MRIKSKILERDINTALGVQVDPNSGESTPEKKEESEKEESEDDEDEDGEEGDEAKPKKGKKN